MSKTKPKIRLDLLLVERGLAESREKAKLLLLSGNIRGEQGQILKPGAEVSPGIVLRQEAKMPFVSRGGDKLACALQAFQLDCTGLTCLDVGASTGGFTDCLLQAGAAKVYALDVGKAQLHQSLLQDPRVIALDERNARFMEPGDLPEKVDLITIDASFISLTLILPRLPGLLAPGGEIVALVKPQFEAGKEKVEKGGIVRDKFVHRQVLEKVANCGLELGLSFLGACRAPVLPRKNREYLVRLGLGGESLPDFTQEIKKVVEDGN